MHPLLLYISNHHHRSLWHRGRNIHLLLLLILPHSPIDHQSRTTFFANTSPIQEPQFKLLWGFSSISSTVWQGRTTSLREHSHLVWPFPQQHRYEWTGAVHLPKQTGENRRLLIGLSVLRILTTAASRTLSHNCKLKQPTNLPFVSKLIDPDSQNQTSIHSLRKSCPFSARSQDQQQLLSHQTPQAIKKPQTTSPYHSPKYTKQVEVQKSFVKGFLVTCRSASQEERGRDGKSTCLVLKRKKAEERAGSSRQVEKERICINTRNGRPAYDRLHTRTRGSF